MSIYSGKCDLYDHIAGTAGWYDRNGNPVKFGDENVGGAYYSDEMKDFLEFKKRTGGVLYQNKETTVDLWNQYEVAKRCKGELEITKHIEEIEDKRCKDGIKTKATYTYKYWGKEYKTLKELNKHGVYVTVEIRFNTILDLIQYYPYIVCASFYSEGKEIVFISKESFVDYEYNHAVENGWFPSLRDHYKNKLQQHYLEVCKNYLLYKYDERVCIEDITNYKYYDNGFYVVEVENEVDENHDIEFYFEGERTPQWCSPKLLEKNKILVSNQDIENYLSEKIKDNTVKIKYIKKVELPKILG